MCAPVFASSLLSLISPWAPSRAARYPPSQLRWPPLPPRPPPPPRRHSDPTSKSTPALNHQPKLRRHSDIRNPKSKLDLRQELQNLNLNNNEVDKWLGTRFDEKDEFDYEVRFAHDIPLQRSISLDGGIDIFNYLQTLDSEWSASTDEGSVWTLDSDRGLVFEQYRSFEDIPASQVKVKSRRVSEYDNAPLGRNLALNVLKDSYKCLDVESGSVSPQIKKLRRCFTFTDFSEDFKEAGKSVEDLENQDAKRNDNEDKEVFLPKGMRQRSFSVKNSLENLKDKYARKNSGQIDMDYLEVRFPVYRSISVESKSQEREEALMTRQRRVGVYMHSYGIKKEVNLRKEVLIKRNLKECKSCENIALQKGNESQLKSAEMKCMSTTPVQIRSSYNLNVGSDKSSSLKLKRTFSYVGPTENNRVLPAIVISNTEEVDSIDSVAKTENKIPTNTSNLVELSRSCDCRICTDVEVDRVYFFVKFCFLTRDLHVYVYEKIFCIKLLPFPLVL
ncbi:hypothetical protein K1T71_011289 [Dendrolimus kikuchii]|uniref:Uncharacterized protein n=1 Tax=Dendrolimus kikuchii TaxID=765133 RepID=A0ACC1CNJ7_9NEOP|nr:hypothetical protein K1T71_011289 [Dendrolimus kikuchii]